MSPGSAEAEPIVLPDILDVEPTLGCTQLVPHAVSVDNTPVRLEVRILLDGVPQAEAATAVTEMRTAYSPLNIDVVATYQTVSFTGLDGGGLRPLIGGHHHYASVEGLFALDPDVMTLMGPTLSVISLKFSTLNTLMVKAHAQLYATP